MLEYRLRLEAQEAQTMQNLVRKWIEIENRLQAMIDALTQQTAGQVLTARQLYKLERYQAFLSQAKAEVDRYARWAAGEIRRNQELNTSYGVQSAQDAIHAAYTDAGVQGSFYRIPVKAVNTLIGMAGDGSPLYDLLQGAYPDAVNALTQALINGLVQGWNPKKIAALMAQDMQGNLQRALVIARTEQLRAYREAFRQQMEDSGVVRDYVRRCSLSSRTCPACLALDGTIYPTGQMFAQHPQDRCYMEPRLKDVPDMQVETGEEWFMRQPDTVQRDILGPGHYQGWKDGAFSFKDLAQIEHNDTWGDTVRVRPLRDLIGQ